MTGTNSTHQCLQTRSTNEIADRGIFQNDARIEKSLYRTLRIRVWKKWLCRLLSRCCCSCCSCCCPPPGSPSGRANFLVYQKSHQRWGQRPLNHARGYRALYERDPQVPRTSWGPACQLEKSQQRQARASTSKSTDSVRRCASAAPTATCEAEREPLQ
jgi:hypothetical protein